MSINLWRDSYKTGNKNIDIQHYQLFQKVGSLMEIAKSDDTELQHRQCLDLVDFLIYYTMEHFETEEALQKQTGYVSYEQHARIHAHFKNTAFAYHKKIHEQYSADVLQNFVGTLMSWLVMHVCGCDQKILRNEPLKPDYASVQASSLVPAALSKIFSQLYRIQILEVSPCVYKGYVEGKVFLRSAALIGEKKYTLLYGMSEELTRALYRSVSGMEIEDIHSLSILEQSALTELGDLMSSHILCAENTVGLNNIKMQNVIFTNENCAEKVNSQENLLFDFKTDQGRLEVLYCA